MPAQLVISFHGIGDAPAHVSADERPYWVDPDEFEQLTQECLRVAGAFDVELLVTFDDGNRSDLEIAAPRLSTLGVPAAFFPCTGRLDHPDYLSRDDLHALVDMGFEIGSHGIDHLPWPSLDVDAATREIRDSRSCLEDVLGQPVESAAIPFGAYNRRVLEGIRQAGYQTAFCSDDGLAHSNHWLRPRLTFRSGDTAQGVRATVQRYRSVAFRAVTGAKGLVKRWRP